MKPVHWIKQRVVKSHIDKIEVYRLEKSQSFKRADYYMVFRSYNGIGPDRFPWILRTFTSVLFRQFAPAALIHDVDYQTIIDLYVQGAVTLKKAREMHADADRLFYANCRRMINAWYSACNPVAWALHATSAVFFFCVRTYGWRGIAQGINARRARIWRAMR